MTMADDAHEERFHQHEAIMEGVARMLEAQHGMNERQDGINARLAHAIERMDRTFAQQLEFNADVKITLARIETLLARMIPTGENGREA
jgi:hypothetical protein